MLHLAFRNSLDSDIFKIFNLCLTAEPPERYVRNKMDVGLRKMPGSSQAVWTRHVKVEGRHPKGVIQRVDVGSRLPGLDVIRNDGFAAKILVD